MSVHSVAVSLVFFPFTFVDVAISVDQPASAVRFVAGPEALIAGPVDPDLDTAALSDLSVFDPFSFVFGSILEEDDRTLDKYFFASLGSAIFEQWELLHDALTCR